MYPIIQKENIYTHHMGGKNSVLWAYGSISKLDWFLNYVIVQTMADSYNKALQD